MRVSSPGPVDVAEERRVQRPEPSPVRCPTVRQPAGCGAAAGLDGDPVRVGHRPDWRSGALDATLLGYIYLRGRGPAFSSRRT